MELQEKISNYLSALNEASCGCDSNCSCGGNCGSNCNCKSNCKPVNESVQEDKTDSMKRDKLNDMFQALERLNGEFDELATMDMNYDSTGAGDLTDQLTTMRKHIEALYQVLDRSSAIVPMEGEVNEYRMSYGDADKLGRENASKIDNILRRTVADSGKDIRDVEMGDLEELRWKIAKELGLVEAKNEKAKNEDINRLKKLSGLPVDEGYMSDIDAEAQQFVHDAIEHAKDIQKDNYYFSDSTYYEFTDFLDTDNDILMDHPMVQEILKKLPHVDMDDSEIKQHVDALANMKIGEADEIIQSIPSKTVKLAGDSIWDRDGSNPESVQVSNVTIENPYEPGGYMDDDEDDGYRKVSVEHDGPWTIYTDSGFEAAISKMVGFKVVFTEQGMQEDGMASMEGGSEGFDEAKNTPVSDNVNRLKQLAGV